MAIGIDPTIDFAFKRLLGNPEHAAVTIHFLNAVLGEETRIREIEFMNPIIDQEFAEDKWSILDILARDDHGRWLNIEMQTSLPAALAERLVFYAGSLLVGQLRVGESYRELAPAIGICVTNGVLFANCPDLHLDFRLRSRAAEAVLSDHLQIHLIELPKYVPPANNERIRDPIEQWAYFFRSAMWSTPAHLGRRLGDAVFVEAAGVLEMISRTPNDRYMYELRLKAQRDEQARLEYAIEEGLKRGNTEGRASGIAEGRAEGIVEGRVEGRAEGRQIGECLGKIKVLMDLLGIDPPTDLEVRSLPELTQLATELQQRLHPRRQ